VSWRLSGIAPDLVEQLEGESEAQLRRTAEAVVDAALRATKVGSGTVKQALAALQAGRHGALEERRVVKQLADRLDESAWDLQDRVEAGEAGRDEYLDEFRRARAVTALWFALEPDPLVAAVEVAYEARAATDDDVVRREIAAVSS
jgi:hypothetical protein